MKCIYKRPCIKIRYLILSYISDELFGSNIHYQHHSRFAMYRISDAHADELWRQNRPRSSLPRYMLWHIHQELSGGPSFAEIGLLRPELCFVRVLIAEDMVEVGQRCTKFRGFTRMNHSHDQQPRMIQRASGTKNGTNYRCRSVRTLDEHESMY